MHLKIIEESSVSSVKWIGTHDPRLNIPCLQHKHVFLYSKCIIGPITLSIGDFVLVSNADASEPDSIEGCDIAKILHLYELREMSDRDPCRALVQWYSRPDCIPHKYFDNDNICIDFDTELIEEHRPYDSDISLETVFRKCSVIYGPIEVSAAELLQNFNAKSKMCTMFVCRYKFLKIKNSYSLVPLQFANDMEFRHNECRSVNEGVNLKTKISSTNKTKYSSVSAKNFAVDKGGGATSKSNTVEFVDLNYFHKVSPIKIIGGRSVVRLSANKSFYSDNKKNEPIFDHNNTLSVSPLSEKNITLTPRLRAKSAKKNLNLSLDNSEADTTADSDYLNYSIVKGTPDTQQSLNEMKIKLRLSERRRSSRLLSVDEDPLALQQQDHMGFANREIYNTPDIYHTPIKRPREANDVTPPNRRKSILKSATLKPTDGTPRKSIFLSNIVEKRIFDNEEIINSSKSSKPLKSIVCSSNRKIDKILHTEHPATKTFKQNFCRNTTKVENTEDRNALPSKKLKMIGSGETKPTLEKRATLTDEHTNKTELEITCERLHVSVVPDSLPCREKEFANIYKFLESKINDQCGGCMYVSGVPGTGKTATVTCVIQSLLKKVSEDELQPFEFLEINGMRLTEPRQAYVHIYKKLTGKTLSWEHAHALLQKRFNTSAPRRLMTVLLVDELDILCNRRQDVVYNLLDWPTKSVARLVVVTIANTMDLPERLLMGKNTSRLGLTRLTFPPYSHKQLQEIVTARLNGSEAFKSDAVQLVARKVAAVSGDARRALDICRRATEIAVGDTSKSGENGLQFVNMGHVQQALTEMIASAKVQGIKNCSRSEKIFLQGIVAELNRTGIEEASFLGVYSQIEAIVAFTGASMPTPGHALRICSKLGAERLIICEHSRNDIFQKILLNVSVDDIHYALKINNN